jgi:hypothetical protein
MRKVRAVPRYCELYPGICLTTEEYHGKTSVRVAEECQLALYLPLDVKFKEQDYNCPLSTP